ncbi:MAG: hypothetical protein HOA44_00755, partial [Methylococcales bacterium]|nr:hypothetical protein [Methylococcales bacterium]
WTSWYESGKKKETITYKNGELEGLWTRWYENGQKRYEGHYKNDKKDGLWTDWGKEGNIVTTETYQEGLLVQLN